MITFLITPVKSKRDSLLFETPINKLQFDVAETPVLFDSLSVNQLKKLQSLNDNKTIATSKPDYNRMCGYTAVYGNISVNNNSNYKYMVVKNFKWWAFR